jgi:hypothetical protein
MLPMQISWIFRYEVVDYTLPVGPDAPVWVTKVKSSVAEPKPEPQGAVSFWWSRRRNVKRLQHLFKNGTNSNSFLGF